MANTLKLEIVTAEGPVYSEDVEMVTLPGVTGQFGVYPQHVPLITQMVPGEIIVRRGRPRYLLRDGLGTHRSHGHLRRRSLPIWRFKPTRLTKPRPRKPGNAPKRGSKINSPTKKSPTSTPRWLARWRSCASSAGRIHNVRKPISSRMNRTSRKRKVESTRVHRCRALLRGNKV